MLTVGCGVIGMVFSITPIPYLPIMYWAGVLEFRREHSLGTAAVFAVSNVLWAAFPVALVLGVFSTSGGLPALVFALAMYSPFLLFPSEPADSDHSEHSP